MHWDWHGCGTTFETMPCHCCASTVELAKLMCHAELKLSVELNWFPNIAPQSNLMVELSSARQWRDVWNRPYFWQFFTFSLWLRLSIPTTWLSPITVKPFPSREWSLHNKKWYGCSVKSSSRLEKRKEGRGRKEQMNGGQNGGGEGGREREKGRKEWGLGILLNETQESSP